MHLLEFYCVTVCSFSLYSQFVHSTILLLLSCSYQLNLTHNGQILMLSIINLTRIGPFNQWGFSE